MGKMVKKRGGKSRTVTSVVSTAAKEAAYNAARYAARQAAMYASDQASRWWTTPSGKARPSVGTPGGGNLPVKRFGTSSSKSAGIIRKLKRVKRNRRLKKTVFKGVEKTVEAFKNEGTTGQSLNILHGTFARDQILEMTWKAVIKQFFAQQKVYITDWNGAAEPYNGSEWRINTSFIVDGVAQNGVPLTMGTPITYQGIVNYFLQSTQPWNSPGNNVQMDYLELSSSVTPLYRPFARLNLRKVKIHYDIKSSMKMQNRTINSTGNNESDDVDNVPLIGKIYQFKGTGLVRPKVNSDAQVYINEFSGYAVAPEAVDRNYNEPIDAMYYDRCKRSGKIKLEPGEIKTSVIQDSGTMYLSTILRVCSMAYLNVRPQLNVGKCRMYSLEKILDTLVDGAAFGIVLGVEVNNRYRFSAKLMPTYINAPEYQRIPA